MAEDLLALLLDPVSPDRACGPDLGVTPEFVLLRQNAETLLAGNGDGGNGEADRWRALSQQTLGLLRRSRDLWLVVWMTSAWARSEGYVGLRNGLALLHGLLDRYWDAVYPTRDDGEYPQRVNAILELNSPAFLRLVRRLPLTQAGQMGAVTLRDLQLSQGDLSLPSGSDETAPDPAKLNALLREAVTREGQAFQARIAALKQSVELIDKIHAVQAPHIPSTDQADLSDLRALLARAVELVEAAVQMPGTSPASAVEQTGMESAAATPDATPGGPMQIRSREDVVRALDTITSYYEANVPESPIPLLLRRVRSLVHKNFLDVMKDLAPGSVSDVRKLAGLEENENG
jgi:type VI secretion system protein ImpA